MIVITGASGNVGREIVPLLLQSGTAFRALGRDAGALKRRFGPGLDAVDFDFANPASWDAALAGVRFLLIVLPIPRPQIINQQIKPFIRSAIAKGCQHIAYISVPAAAHNAKIPHHITERFLEGCGIDYTLLRAAYFMQNFSRPDPGHDVDLRDRDELYLPLGSDVHYLIDTRDLAAATVAVMLNPKAHARKAYDLVGDIKTMPEAAQVFSDILGRPIHYTDASLWGFSWRAFRRGARLSLIVAMAYVYGLLSRQTRVEPLDDGDLSALLECRPLSLRDYVRDYRECWAKK
ncbi:MAG: NmrA family NAD(P)-binding protein [Gammaproteobacteria bacterium]